MQTIKDFTGNSYLNQTEANQYSTEAIQPEFKKKEKITSYLDYVYSYPPKIKIKWDRVDELKDDSFARNNYKFNKQTTPYNDSFEEWFFANVKEEAITTNYPMSKYLDGFLDKINSSNFFLKKTKKIQKTLEKIPVFVILNGQNEIVLSKPSNNLTTKSVANYINEKVYDFAGAFDSQVEKQSQMGLFFMNLGDAEKYIKEVAKADFGGTQTVGLTIHCTSLDSAYKITREHHPGIDFRFVPDFKEVKNLLKNDIGKSDMIIEDEQQQLRFRTRTANLFPYLKKLGSYLSPSSSFLQRNEYFKGVPIYIVQISHKPRNIIFEQYYKTIGTLDTAYGKAIQSLDSIIGFGHNWIMQGSLQDAGNSEKFTNFIFFDKTQAAQFVKKQGRNVARYSGSHAPELASIIRKPKIFVYNLEDFLESWEDSNSAELATNNTSLPQTIYKTHATHFVSPPQIQNEVLEIKQNIKENAFNGVINGFGLKLRTLKRTLEIFFSIY